MKKKFRIIFVALISVVIVGCSDGPSSSTLNKAYEDYAIENAVDGIFNIQNVQKTNGYMLDGIYNVEISFERHFVAGVDEVINQLNSEVASSEPTNKMEKMAMGLFGMASGTGMLRMVLVNQYGEFSRGEVHNMTHKIQFVETENGWQTYN